MSGQANPVVEYLDMTEAAALLAVHPKRLRSAVREAKIGTYRCRFDRRRRLLRRDDVMRLLTPAPIDPNGGLPMPPA